MIIFKDTLSVITRSDTPNENWADEENVFVVDDTSELGGKILTIMPYFDFVLDGQGNLIDVTPTERPPEPPPEPTLDDYMLDLDFRVSMIELGV